MEMVIKVLAFFALVCAVQAAKPEKVATNFTGRYLIIAPRTIRPSLPYSVSVNILDESQPIIVDMSILDDQNKTVAHAQGLSGRDFKAGEAQTVSFDALPSNLAPDSRYRLNAKGKHSTSGKMLFNEEKDLQIEAKSRSTFIQTDKAIYKPGSTVHFRVVAVTPDLKPYKGKANIKITDPNENLIKQYLDQAFDGGVLGKQDSLKLQLSDEPPLGDWKITVDVDNQKTEKSFTVDKYVLPKFDVSVKTPAYIQFKDDFSINVTAKYTYGKGVAGQLLVEATIPYYYLPIPYDWAHRSGNEGPVSPKMVKTVDLDSDGETTVPFTNAELKEHRLMYDNFTNDVVFIEFTAQVTEKFSNTQKNATSSLSAYKHIHRIQMEKQVDTFKPGLDYNVTISVVTQDSKPMNANADKNIFLTIYYQVPLPPEPTTTTTTTTVAPGSNITTTVTFSDYYYQPLTTELVDQKQLTLNSDGTYLLTLNPPLNATSLRLEVHYSKNDSDISTTIYAEASKSPTDSYLQLLAKSASVTAGDDISFRIRTTQDVDGITVQVMSKGYIILSKHVKLNGQSGEISFKSTSDMAPKSRIIAYAVKSDNKEILVDAMDFQVQGLFRNNVSIEVAPTRVEPNQTVTFTVHGAPQSYVGLLAVDQSVLLLKSGNDISSDQVEGDITNYGNSYYYGGPFGRRKRSMWCRWCWWNIGGQDASSVFDNSGVVVLTDAYLYKQPPPPIRLLKSGGGGRSLGRSNADGIVNKKTEEINDKPKPPDSSPSDSFGEKISQPTIRKNFPETWVWVDVIAK